MVFHAIEFYTPIKLNEVVLHVSTWVYHKNISNERKEYMCQGPIRKHGTLMFDGV